MLQSRYKSVFFDPLNYAKEIQAFGSNLNSDRKCFIMHYSTIGYSFAALALMTSYAIGSKSDEKVVKSNKPLMSWTGPKSQIREPKYLRITNEKQWNKVWLEHLGKNKNQAFNDSDVQIQIDFSKCDLIAIFQGSGWNSRGIRLEAVKQTEDKITIRYDSISYQTSGIDGGGVRVSTFTFLVFPKTSKSYQLEENSQGLKGQPAKWTHRAVLKSK